MKTTARVLGAVLALAAAWLPPAPVAAADADRSVGERVDDAALATKVKAALVTDNEAKARRIEVETRAGVVTLTGVAESRTEADAAVKAARAVEGVRSVDDQIQVGVKR